MKAADARSPAMLATEQAYVDETLYSRFDDHATGITIAIHQRLHEDDITGHLLATGEFEHLNLPAIAVDHQSLPMTPFGVFERAPGDVLAPDVVSGEELARIERRVGPAVFAAQYLQNPTPPGGNRIRWEYFTHHDDPPERTDCMAVIQSWDTAMSAEPGSDYCVCLTFGFHDKRWKLLDHFRRRLDYADQVDHAMRLYRRWRPDTILIEKAATGYALAKHLRNDRSCLATIYSAPTVKDKETRVEVQIAKLREGLVSLPAEAPWRAEFRAEVMGFPNARNDDQVDALVQLLEYLDGRRWRLFQLRDPVSGRRNIQRHEVVRRNFLRL